MISYIVIRTQFIALHSWPDCNVDGMEYLKNTHRHVFYVEMKWRVFHNSRDIEFINMKKRVDLYLSDFINKDLKSTSCEQIAENLLHLFKADFASVFEDNENGAEVWK